jgi:WxcM-like, C-terminal
MSLADVKWIDLPTVADERGMLTSIEAGRQIPFDIRRVFYLHRVCGERGGHAHRSTRQLLLPVAGRFCVELADGTTSANYAMNDPHRGLFVPPLTWIRLAQFSSDAVCLVLADTHFDDVDYIRDWNAFVALSHGERAPT